MTLQRERAKDATHTTALASEVATYERHRAELLGRAKDQFVLIKGDEIVGTFFDRADALKRGYERFGTELKENFMICFLILVWILSDPELEPRGTGDA